MKRRGFIKRLGQAVAGVFALPLCLKAKSPEFKDVSSYTGEAPKEFGDIGNAVVTANCMDDIQAWEMPDYAPDHIFNVLRHKDDILVICAHSIWRVKRNNDGMLWDRELIAYL